MTVREEPASTLLMRLQQASAVLRERGLGAVATGTAEYTSDVTTEQQKALSGISGDSVTAAGDISHMARRAGLQGQVQKAGKRARSGAGGGDDEAETTVTRPFNSSAQFADPGRVIGQADTMVGASSATAGAQAGLMAQVGGQGADGDAGLGSSTGQQRAAQKFKLPSKKVPARPAPPAETTHALSGALQQWFWVTICILLLPCNLMTAASVSC